MYRQKMPRVILAPFVILTGVSIIGANPNHKAAVWHPQSYLRTALVSSKAKPTVTAAMQSNEHRRSGIGGRGARKRTVRGNVATGDIASRDSAHTDHRDRDGVVSGARKIQNSFVVTL